MNVTIGKYILSASFIHPVLKKRKNEET